jgi:hypothetical protein
MTPAAAARPPKALAFRRSIQVDLHRALGFLLPGSPLRAGCTPRCTQQTLIPAHIGRSISPASQAANRRSRFAGSSMIRRNDSPPVEHFPLLRDHDARSAVIPLLRGLDWGADEIPAIKIPDYKREVRPAVSCGPADFELKSGAIYHPWLI